MKNSGSVCAYDRSMSIEISSRIKCLSILVRGDFRGVFFSVLINLDDLRRRKIKFGVCRHLLPARLTLEPYDSTFYELSDFSSFKLGHVFYLGLGLCLALFLFSIGLFPFEKRSGRSWKDFRRESRPMRRRKCQTTHSPAK